MEAAAAATAAARGGSLVRSRAAHAYGDARGPRRRVVGAGLVAASGGRRRGVLVASLQEPLEAALSSLAQEGAVPVTPQADEAEEVPHSAAAAAVAATENSSRAGVPAKAVRVRFVLKKQCAFGQSFHLVGDVPALGVWDPSKAVAMEWSDGHTWIVEKDLPANAQIEFKFLLRDSSGKFHWQSGPNRSLRASETANTLVVHEDWGDVKNRKIAEEEGDTSFGMEKQVVSCDGESMERVILQDELQVNENQDVKENESTVGDDEKSAINADVAMNATVQAELVEANEPNPPEVPVQSMMQEELKIVDEFHEKEDMENSSASCAEENYTDKTEGDDILAEPEDGVPVENGLTSAFEHDLLWGWKALQQLLMSLGFKMDAT
ncbi:hypothetical protein ACP70R_034283 [Stipagrostis hirtigluma subsp. patula]